MFRRSLALAGALALVFSVAASAAVVRIRVEGKTRTIYAPTERRVSAPDALSALLTASRAGEFYVDVAATSFGPFVDQIGLYPGAADAGWEYKVNGISPPVDAHDYVLHPGDRVLWYWATFGRTGGPPTLLLERFRANCYRVWKQNDAGVRTAAFGAVLHVGSRRTVRTQGAAGSALACVGRHRGLLVRATLPGAVRSNALP